MTVLDQTDKLGLEKLILLDKLNLLIGDFIITGSISLLAFDCLNRKVNDIDIVITDLKKINILKNKNIDLSESFDYNLEIETNDYIHKGKPLKIKVPNRFRIEIDNIKVCIFYSKTIQSKEIRFIGNRIFKVTLPEYSIKNKINYVENINKIELMNPLSKELKIIKQKHLEDIWFYQKI